MKQDPKEEPATYHRPEYVVLDDEGKDSAYGHKQEEQYQYLFRNLKKIESTWIVRILAFIVFFLLVAVAFFSLFFVAINFLLAALTLFQNVKVYQAALKSWKNFKKILTCTLGLGITVFSPTLGLGLIFLYFMINNEPLDPRFTARFMKE
jgi:ABC-type spermidine/putrescine transport system permease subunit I